jgi:vacuolar-type H+-ATPase subunit H
VSALSQLLERLRRVHSPPGAAAGAVAVPSAGEELSGEVAFLLEQLDQIEQQGNAIVASARAEASQLESAAADERRRLLDASRAEAEQVAARLLVERRAACERQAMTMAADAQREAERVLARGRERTPDLIEEVIRRLLEAGA